MVTLVLFDIGDTRLRTRVQRVCRDAGMSRRQFSVFAGFLPESRRERLCERLNALVAAHVKEEDADKKKQALVVDVFVLCAADGAKAARINRQGQRNPELPKPGGVVVI